jgi:hypothetical protein
MNIPADDRTEFAADTRAIWAARIELVVKPGTAEYERGLRGGFTTVLVRCNSANEFIAAATEHLAREGFDIKAITNLDRLSSGNFEINEMIAGLIKETRRYPVQWAAFHLFPA